MAGKKAGSPAPDWQGQLEREVNEHHRDIEAAANIGEFLESLEWWHESLLSTAQAVGKGDPIAAAFEADTTLIAKDVLRKARKAARRLKINVVEPSASLPIVDRFADLIRQVQLAPPKEPAVPIEPAQSVVSKAEKKSAKGKGRKPRSAKDQAKANAADERLIAAWKNSGLSKLDYCKSEGLTASNKDRNAITKAQGRKRARQQRKVGRTK